MHQIEWRKQYDDCTRYKYFGCTLLAWPSPHKGFDVSTEKGVKVSKSSLKHEIEQQPNVLLVNMADTAKLAEAVKTELKDAAKYALFDENGTVLASNFTVRHDLAHPPPNTSCSELCKYGRPWLLCSLPVSVARNNVASGKRSRVEAHHSDLRGPG